MCVLDFMINIFNNKKTGYGFASAWTDSGEEIIKWTEETNEELKNNIRRQCR